MTNEDQTKIIQEELDHLSDKINLLHQLVADKGKDTHVRTINPTAHQLAKVLLQLPDIPVGIWQEGSIAGSVEVVSVRKNELSDVTYDSERVPHDKPKEIVVLHVNHDDA